MSFPHEVQIIPRGGRGDAHGFARSLIIEAVTPPPETDLEKGVLALSGLADSPAAIGEGWETEG